MRLARLAPAAGHRSGEYFILRSLVTASFRKAEARAFLRLLFSCGGHDEQLQFSYGPRYACSDSIRMPSQSERTYKVVLLYSTFSSGEQRTTCRVNCINRVEPRDETSAAGLHTHNLARTRGTMIASDSARRLDVLRGHVVNTVSRLLHPSAHRPERFVVDFSLTRQISHSQQPPDLLGDGS